jgi:hypothetical protein
MEILWWLEAPFWQKMYYFTMLGGVSTFVYLMLIEYDKIKAEWKVKKMNIIKGVCFGIIALFMMTFMSFDDNDNESDMIVKSMDIAESVDHWNHYLGLFWDDRTIGTLCDKTPGFSYSWSDSRATLTVNETDFDDNICMRFNKTSAVAGADATFTRTLDGYYRFTTKIAVAVNTTAVGLWVYESTTLKLGIGFDAMRVYVWDGASVSYSYIQANTWYLLDIRLSTINDTYRAYMNSVLLESGNIPSGITSISKVVYRFPTSATGLWYMDDFCIYDWADYEYTTDIFFEEIKLALDYTYSNYYNPGATGTLNDDSVIIGYEYSENMSYPRISKAYILEAAIKCYEITLEHKYYAMALDIGRWLDEVAQNEMGYYEFIGGSAPNAVNNILTSFEIAGSMTRLYELTHNDRWLISALAAVDYQITYSWDSTLDLFADSPSSSFHRTNLNTAAAANLAYIATVTNNVQYANISATILTNLIPYSHSGIATDYVNYSGAATWSLMVNDEDYQSWSYESYSANGYCMAIYYLQQFGGYELIEDNWITEATKHIYAIYLNAIPYSMISNVSTHNYLEHITAIAYYTLITENQQTIFEESFYSMIEYCTNRASYNLISTEFIPSNQFYDSPDYILGSFTSIGQIADIWDFELIPNFEQPYRYTLDSEARLTVSDTRDNVTITNIEQDSYSIKWTSTTTQNITYILYAMDYTPGLTTHTYTVYKDGEIIGKIGGEYDEGLIFTSYGSGDFEVIPVNNPYAEPFAHLIIFLIIIGIAATVIIYVIGSLRSG